MSFWKIDRPHGRPQIVEEQNCSNVCCLSAFSHRSDSFARAYKGAFTVQHPVKDSAAACRNQGCKATLKGDEKGKGVSYYL